MSDKIRERIGASDMFVALCTKRHRIEKEGGWTTSPWVIEEKGYSLGQNPMRPILIIVESGIAVPAETGGVEGDLEYIRFDRSHLAELAQKIRVMLSGWAKK